MPKGRSSMAGGMPAVLQCCCPWGEVRFGATESDGRLSGGGFSGRWRLAMQRAAGLGWVGLAGLVCRLIKIVIPGEAQRRPGIHALLKEAGFPPLRE